VTGDGSGTLLILGLVLLIVGGVHLAKEYLNERPITLEHMGITSRSKSGPIKYDPPAKRGSAPGTSTSPTPVMSRAPCTLLGRSSRH
jgi:hypothetical protein